MSTSKGNLPPLAGSMADELEQSEYAAQGTHVDHARIEQAVREILLAVGEDPDREGLLQTPARVARMYAEIFNGLHENPSDHLKKFF